MDQGVIRSLKAHYRRRIVRLCIKAVDKNEPLPKISILQAMKDLVSSWNAVSKETVVNCPKYGNEIQSLALKLEDLMKVEKIDSLKQRQVTDFFQKL